MTFEQFINDVGQIYGQQRKHDKSVRYGQVFFNHLHAVNPKLARRIHGTAHDPFFKKDVPSDTMAYVAINWNWESNSL